MNRYNQSDPSILNALLMYNESSPDSCSSAAHIFSDACSIATRFSNDDCLKYLTSFESIPNNDPATITLLWKENINELYCNLKQHARCHCGRERSEVYAAISYRIAFMKTHFPLELKAAELNYRLGDSAELEMEIRASQDMGFSILPPDINKSNVKCSPEGNAIRLGLLAITNIKANSVDHILAIRNQEDVNAMDQGVSRKFKTFDGFLRQIDSNIVREEDILLLLKAGAFKAIIDNPCAAIQSLTSAIAGIKQHLELDRPTDDLTPEHNVYRWSFLERLNAEYEALGFYISDHPLQYYMPSFLKENLSNVKPVGLSKPYTLFVRIVSVRTYKTSNILGESEMAFVTIDDPFSLRHAYILPANFSSIKADISVNKLLLINAIYSEPKRFDQAIEIIDAYNIERPLPDIKQKLFHFSYVRYMAEKEISISTASRIVKNIKKMPGKEYFEITSIPLYDHATYVHLQKTHDNPFTLLSPHSCSYLADMTPKTFEELAIAVRLSSPILCYYGITEAYISCMQGKEKPSYLIPELEPILEPTYGFIIYQEQIRQIVEVLAGFTHDESSAFYRALTKQHPSDMIKIRKQLIHGVNKLLPKDEAAILFDWLTKFASSAMKKAAWIEELTLCYQMAWFSVHYPKVLESTSSLDS